MVNDFSTYQISKVLVYTCATKLIWHFYIDFQNQSMQLVLKTKVNKKLPFLLYIYRIMYKSFLLQMFTEHRVNNFIIFTSIHIRYMYWALINRIFQNIVIIHSGSQVNAWCKIGYFNTLNLHCVKKTLKWWRCKFT